MAGFPRRGGGRAAKARVDRLNKRLKGLVGAVAKPARISPALPAELEAYKDTIDVVVADRLQRP